MLLEEYRLNTSMIGRVQFLFFPIMITVFALIISLSSGVLLHAMPMNRVYFIFHGIILAYGLGVGGFALFGEHIAERRFGQINLLLSTPATQPVEFREVFMVFYVKDIIYYILFSLVPLIAGITLSIPITHFHATSVAFLFLTMMLTFLFGISLSFCLSTVYVRNRTVFGCVLGGIAIAAACAYFTKWFSIRLLLPTLMYQYTHGIVYFLATVVLIIIFSAIAVRFLKIEFGKRIERFEASVLAVRKKLTFFGKYSIFAAKEWLDIRRSKTFYPILSAYVGPLVFIAIMQWFLKSALALPISFNLIFYAILIGFFGVTIYSWLNITDSPVFYQILPVTVPDIIRTKLGFLALVTFTVPAVFLVALGIFNSELLLILPAIAVAAVVSTYTVMVTAYLTGLRTNSYLFDPKILARFGLLVIPPLISLSIASFTLADLPQYAMPVIVCTCLLMLLSIMALYTRIDKKWARESFEF